jgi:hypothetical protein
MFGGFMNGKLKEGLRLIVEPSLMRAVSTNAKELQSLYCCGNTDR